MTVCGFCLPALTIEPDVQLEGGPNLPDGAECWRCGITAEEERERLST